MSCLQYDQELARLQRISGTAACPVERLSALQLIDRSLEFSGQAAFERKTMWIEVEKYRVSLLAKGTEGMFDRITVIHADDFYDLFRVNLKELSDEQRFEVEVKLEVK